MREPKSVIVLKSYVAILPRMIGLVNEARSSSGSS